MNYSDYTLVEFNSLGASNLEQMYKYSHSLINRSTDLAYCIDKNARFLYANEATCSTTGYSGNELMSMTMEAIDTELCEESWSHSWQTIKQNKSYSFVSRYRTKTGKIFPVEVRISYVDYEGIEFGCVFARATENESTSIQKDVSQPKFDLSESTQVSSEYEASVAELEKSLCVLRSTLESTANGILAVNFEGEILCYNQKFVDMWHLPNEVKITKGCDRAKAYFESQVK